MNVTYHVQSRMTSTAEISTYKRADCSTCRLDTRQMTCSPRRRAAAAATQDDDNIGDALPWQQHCALAYNLSLCDAWCVWAEPLTMCAVHDFNNVLCVHLLLSIPLSARRQFPLDYSFSSTVLARQRLISSSRSLTVKHYTTHAVSTSNFQVNLD